MKKIYELMAKPDFNLASLERFLYTQGYMAYTRTHAFSLAKELRSQYPLCFIRVLKVNTTYFVITNEFAYNLFWDVRKVAMRNERRIKNEIV